MTVFFGFQLVKIRDLEGFRPVFLLSRWDFCQPRVRTRPRTRCGVGEYLRAPFDNFRKLSNGSLDLTHMQKLVFARVLKRFRVRVWTNA